MKKIISLFLIMIVSNVAIAVESCGKPINETELELWSKNPTFKSPLKSANSQYRNPSGKLSSEIPPEWTGEYVSSLDKARASVAASFTEANPSVTDEEYNQNIGEVIFDGLEVSENNIENRDVLFTSNEINYTGSAFVYFQLYKDGNPIIDNRPEIMGNDINDPLFIKLAGEEPTASEVKEINKMINNEFDKLNGSLSDGESVFSVKHNDSELKIKDSAEIIVGMKAGEYTREFLVSTNNRKIKGVALIHIRVLSNKIYDLVDVDPITFNMGSTLLTAAESKLVKKLVSDALIKQIQKTYGITISEFSFEKPEIFEWSGELQKPGEYEILYQSKKNNVNTQIKGTSKGKLKLIPDNRTFITTPNPGYIKIKFGSMSKTEALTFSNEIVSEFRKKNNNIPSTEFEITGGIEGGDKIQNIQNIFKEGSKNGKYELQFSAKQDSKKFRGIVFQKYYIQGDLRVLIQDYSLDIKLKTDFIGEIYPSGEEGTSVQEVKDIIKKSLEDKYKGLKSSINNDEDIIWDWKNIVNNKNGITNVRASVKFEDDLNYKILFKGSATIKINLIPRNKLSGGNWTANANYVTAGNEITGLKPNGEPIDPSKADRNSEVYKIYIFLLKEFLTVIPDAGPSSFTISFSEWGSLKYDDINNISFLISKDNEILSEGSLEFKLIISKNQITIDVSSTDAKVFFNPYKEYFGSQSSSGFDRPKSRYGDDNGRMNHIIQLETFYPGTSAQYGGTGSKNNEHDYPYLDDKDDFSYNNKQGALKIDKIYRYNTSEGALLGMAEYDPYYKTQGINRRVIFKKDLQQFMRSDYDHFLNYFYQLLIYKFKIYARDISGNFPKFGKIFRDDEADGLKNQDFDFSLHIPSNNVILFESNGALSNDERIFNTYQEDDATISESPIGVKWQKYNYSKSSWGATLKESWACKSLETKFFTTPMVFRFYKSAEIGRMNNNNLIYIKLNDEKFSLKNNFESSSKNKLFITSFKISDVSKKFNDSFEKSCKY